MSYVRKYHKYIQEIHYRCTYKHKKPAINDLSASQLDVWISATSVYHGNTSKDNKRVFFLVIYIKTRFERRNLKKNQIKKEKFCNLHVMITVYFIWGWKENNLRMFTSVHYIWGRLWTSNHTRTQTFSISFRQRTFIFVLFRDIARSPPWINWIFFFSVFFFYFAHCRQVGDNDQNIYKQI